MWRIVHSPFGLHLRSLRDNAQKAEYLGVRVRQFRLAAFVISAVYGAIGGAILGFRTGLADPELVYWTHSGHLVFMTVLGGFSSFLGPVVGALALTLLQDQLQSHTQYWRFVLGAILACVVIFFPRGLAGFADGSCGPSRRPAASAESGTHDPSRRDQGRVQALRRVSRARRRLRLRPRRRVRLDRRTQRRRQDHARQPADRPAGADQGRGLLQGRNIAGVGPVALAERGMARTFQLVQIFPQLTVAETIAAAVVTHQGKQWRLFSPLSRTTRDRRARRRDRRHLRAASSGSHTLSRLLSQGEKKLLDVASAFALEPRGDPARRADLRRLHGREARAS